MTEVERRNKKGGGETREKFRGMNGREGRLTETKSGEQSQSNGRDKIEVTCRWMGKKDD